MKFKSVLVSFWNNSEYLQNFKLFDNVYGILDTSYMTYTVFGMTPYERRKSANCTFVYYDAGWRKYIISGWYTLLLLLGITANVFIEQEKNFDGLKTIINIYLNIQIMILSSITVNIFTARVKILLKAYGHCYKADKILKKLGFQLNYRFIHIIVLFGALSMIVFGFMNLMMYLLLKKGMYRYLKFTLLYSVPTVIVVIPVYHFFYLGAVTINRLRMINNYLEKEFSSLTNKQIELELFGIARVHSELCNSMNNVLYSSAFSIASFYFYTYFQFASLLLGALGIFSFDVGLDTYFWNIIYISTTVAILILASLLKHEGTKTSYILCELTSAFYDECIGTRRNTFLLQMLHQKINFRIYGYFEVHLGRVLSDLQALVNLLLFVTQFRN